MNNDKDKDGEIMPNQEVIFNILDILETMDEGLFYIEGKLDELNIKATTGILVNIIEHSPL